MRRERQHDAPFACASCGRRERALPAAPTCGHCGRGVGADAGFPGTRSPERGRPGSCGSLAGVAALRREEGRWLDLACGARKRGRWGQRNWGIYCCPRCKDGEKGKGGAAGDIGARPVAKQRLGELFGNDRTLASLRPIVIKLTRPVMSETSL